MCHFSYSNYIIVMQRVLYELCSVQHTFTTDFDLTMVAERSLIIWIFLPHFSCLNISQGVNNRRPHCLHIAGVIHFTYEKIKCSFKHPAGSIYCEKVDRLPLGQ